MHRCLHTPVHLHPIAKHVEAALSAGETHSPHGQRTVLVSGEELVFPYRVYYAAETISSMLRKLEGEARLLALCLASRHHDGRIREAAIRDPSYMEVPWSVPFSVQLLGEYVVEIGQVVENRVSVLRKDPFLAFARENPKFMDTTRRRAISYWDCYYRSIYKTLEDFPCYRAVQAVLSAL